MPTNFLNKLTNFTLSAVSAFAGKQPAERSHPELAAPERHSKEITGALRAVLIVLCWLLGVAAAAAFAGAYSGFRL